MLAQARLGGRPRLELQKGHDKIVALAKSACDRFLDILQHRRACGSAAKDSMPDVKFCALTFRLNAAIARTRTIHWLNVIRESRQAMEAIDLPEQTAKLMHFLNMGRDVPFLTCHRLL